MSSASFAEWLIGRLTEKPAAAAIVGDLLEDTPRKGRAGFFLSLAGVMFWLSWRRCVGTVAAFYAGWRIFRSMELAVYGFDAHRPDWYLGQTVLSALSTIATFFWMVLAYSIIRYGVRDRVTQLALASAAIATGIVYAWWLPAVLTACITLGLGTAVVSLITAECRKAALIVTAATVTGFVTGFTGLYLANRYQHFIYPGPLGDKELREHPSILWAGFVVQVLVVWAITTVCARMRRRLLTNANSRHPMETLGRSHAIEP